jgi:hypothetical protein
MRSTGSAWLDEVDALDDTPEDIRVAVRSAAHHA